MAGARVVRSNDEWLYELQEGGSLQEAAIADLRNLLLRATLVVFNGRLADFQGLGGSEILQFAEDCAQDALIALLDHLGDFRGDSKFTTWAYKFAVNISLMRARRERWKGVSLDDLSTELGAGPQWLLPDKSEEVSPEQSALRNEAQDLIRDVIEHDLTDRQRRVLLMMVFHDVPMDEVVQHLGVNRNAVYKMLHDARRKVRSSLEARGFEAGETLSLFGMRG